MRTEPAPIEHVRNGVTLVAEPHEDLFVCAPYTGAVLGYIPSCRAEDVELAVNRARAAQAQWHARACAERARIVLRFHDLLLRRQNEALDIIQRETGKARRHALEEILDTALVCQYYAKRAEGLLRPRRRRGALPLLTKTWEFRYPVGVAGFIVPWNYPLILAVTDAIPALMAGNCGVLTPDPQGSFTALWALNLLREAGMPEDVFQVVTGYGPVVGEALADRVDYLMFTGGTRTGRIVGQRAAAGLIGCSLELGGKNPMLVLADADPNAAVEGALRGCFVGSGQVCISIERIYVHESLYEAFLSAFAERTRRLKMGAAFDYSVDMGSLTVQRQLDTVEAHVGDALSKGATLVTGGRRRPELGPLFYEPTILSGVRPDMRVYAEETFGPVVSVAPFATEDEAIERANASPYGLSASIWSRDTRRAVSLAVRVQAGSVNINEAYAATWGSTDAAIGGVKQSGLRPRHGAEGLLKYTRTQAVAVQQGMAMGPRHGQDAGPYARTMTRLMKLSRWLR